jgi:hypothetical protein
MVRSIAAKRAPRAHGHAESAEKPTVSGEILAARPKMKTRRCRGGEATERSPLQRRLECPTIREQFEGQSAARRHARLFEWIRPPLKADALLTRKIPLDARENSQRLHGAADVPAFLARRAGSRVLRRAARL